MPMRLLALFLVPLVLAVSLSAALAADPSKKPDQFRGIRWGAAVTGQPGLTAVDRDGDIVHYDRKGDVKDLGGIPLRSITYSFFKGQFYHAAIAYEGQDAFAAIERSLEEKYGPPDAQRHKTDSSGQSYEVAVWNWPGQVFIGNRHDQGKPGGRIFYFYAPLTDASAKEQGLAPKQPKPAKPAKAQADLPAGAPQAGASTYTVKRGDYLARIAKRYGLTEAELSAANSGLTDKNLKAGATIRLPAGAGSRPDREEPAAKAPAPTAESHRSTPAGAYIEYTIKPGDILSKVANEHGVQSKDVEAANPDIKPKALRPGMVVRIPLVKAASPRSTAQPAATSAAPQPATTPPAPQPAPAPAGADAPANP